MATSDTILLNILDLQRECFQVEGTRTADADLLCRCESDFGRAQFPLFHLGVRGGFCSSLPKVSKRQAFRPTHPVHNIRCNSVEVTESAMTTYRRENHTIAKGDQALYLLSYTQTWKHMTKERVLLGAMGGIAGGSGRDG